MAMPLTLPAVALYYFNLYNVADVALAATVVFVAGISNWFS
jgi:hypothetical protein